MFKFYLFHLSTILASVFSLLHARPAQAFFDDHVQAYYSLSTTQIVSGSQLDPKLSSVANMDSGTFNGASISASAASLANLTGGSILHVSTHVDNQSTNITTAVSAFSHAQYVDELTLSGTNLPSSIRLHFILSGYRVFPSIFPYNTAQSSVIFGVGFNNQIILAPFFSLSQIPINTTVSLGDQGSNPAGFSFIADVPLSIANTYRFSAVARAGTSGHELANYTNDFDVALVGITYSDDSVIGDRSFSFASGFVIAVPELSTFSILVIVSALLIVGRVVAVVVHRYKSSNGCPEN